jgi:hypothetical protein
MKATPENAVKRALIKLLNSYGVWHYPASAGAYSIGGIPDRICCVGGKFVGIECKAPGKKPTALQAKCHSGIRAVGGVVFVVDGEVSLQEVKMWLDLNQ